MNISKRMKHRDLHTAGNSPRNLLKFKTASLRASVSKDQEVHLPIPGVKKLESSSVQFMDTGKLENIFKFY
jgi:hypothetical protein